MSKDRPAQAHLCIESIKKNDGGLFDNLSVIYTYSNGKHREGYEALKAAFPTVTFIDQENYYEDVKSLVDVRYAFTAFFTDDDIMFTTITKSSEEIKNLFDDYEDVLGCFSLRLGLNTVIQDPYVKSYTSPPSSGLHNKNGFVFWRWSDCPPYMNFGYPMSVDGHIFRTNELNEVLNQCKFTNPNQQEIAMTGKADMVKPLMACFEHSVLVNTPINRVQQTCMNRAGETCGQNPDEMTDKYLAGYKLDINSIQFPIIGCHQELELAWITK